MSWKKMVTSIQYGQKFELQTLVWDRETSSKENEFYYKHSN